MRRENGIVIDEFNDGLSNLDPDIKEIDIEQFISIDRSVEIRGNVNALNKGLSPIEKFFGGWLTIVGVLILSSLGSILVMPLLMLIEGGYGYWPLILAAFLYIPLINEYNNRREWGRRNW